MDDLDKMLNTLKGAVEPVVKHIESSIPTTKDHYADYMTAISSVAELLPIKKDRTPALHLAIGVAMQRAGANKNGVTSALRIMGAL